MAKKKSLFKHVNPEILAWSGKHDLPRFDRIANTDFAPAFEAAMKSGLGEIDAIAGQNKKPGFKNTIVALERAEDALNRVSALFWNRAGADTDETIQALEREITPKLSRYSSQIAMNAKLFRRIDALWQKRKKLKLGTEEERVLERYWKGYVRSGARLPKAQQTRAGLAAETLEDLGETGKSAGRGQSHGRGRDSGGRDSGGRGGQSGRGERSARGTDRTTDEGPSRPRRNRSRRRTRGGQGSPENA